MATQPNLDPRQLAPFTLGRDPADGDRDGNGEYHRITVAANTNYTINFRFNRKPKMLLILRHPGATTPSGYLDGAQALNAPPTPGGTWVVQFPAAVTNLLVWIS